MAWIGNLEEVIQFRWPYRLPEDKQGADVFCIHTFGRLHPHKNLESALTIR